MTSFGPNNGVETIDVTAASGGARILGDWQNNVLDFSAVEVKGSLTIDAGGGNDTVVGTAAADTIVGGQGSDTLSGNGGDDVFRVAGTGCKYNEGCDTYDGGTGQDTIVAVGRNVDIGLKTFSATNGIDVIDFSGVTGKARIVGDSTDNLFDFSAVAIKGNASIDAGGGNDTLLGSAGNDSLLGNWGNDTLNGGAGADRLSGGSGTDTFAFGTDWGQDTVTDFRHGVDKLDFKGAGVVDLAALSISQLGGDTVIAFDGDQVVLQNVQMTSLTASDYLLA
jgi:Ca2+-binding RTX toxin-like protein